MNKPDGTSYTTASTVEAKSLTLADVEEAISKAEALEPKDQDWMLVDPYGRGWKGKPEKLLKVLMLHHPMFKQPSWRTTNEQA